MTEYTVELFKEGGEGEKHLRLPGREAECYPASPLLPGLGTMGLFGWGRKRQNGSAIAATRSKHLIGFRREAVFLLPGRPTCRGAKSLPSP